MKLLKKQLPKLLFFLIVSLIMIIILVNNADLKQIKEKLVNANYKWVWGSVLLILLYILINPTSLMILGYEKKDKVKIIDYFMIGSTEYFFNGITPFATGGQPFQAYGFNKAGMKLSKATGVLLINFVAYQIAVVVCCILSLNFYNKMSANVSNIKMLIFVGITMNVIILFLFIALGASKKIRIGITKIVDWFLSFKIFRKKSNCLKTRFDEYITDAQSAFTNILKSKFKFLLAVISKIVTLIVYYSIPFFILRALGIKLFGIDFLYICAMTCFSIAMTCFIPTPGSSGGIEFAFKTLFASIAGVTSAIAISGMLLWRLLTYYILMIFSFVITVVFDSLDYSKRKEIKEEILENEN